MSVHRINELARELCLHYHEGEHDFFDEEFDDDNAACEVREYWTSVADFLIKKEYITCK